MTGRYKAYPEYKESGVEWFEYIPSSWSCLSLKRNFEVVNGSTPRSGEKTFWDGGITWITPADLSKVNENISISSKTITLEGLSSCGTTLVPTGSLILSTRAPIGTIAIASKELCTNQGCKSLVKTTSLAENKYFYYVLSVSGKQLNNLGRGTTFLELSTDELANYSVPNPSNVEQQKIANFLDHETAKIDTLITKQEKLIELLKEKRQAVISHAVTKGLNPDAPMKDSGVEWLGEVPEHWDVMKFSYAIDFLEGPGILAVDFHDEGIPLLRIQNVKEAFVTDNFKTYLDPVKVKEKWDHFRVENGDLLISASASTGLISEVDERTVGAIPYTGLIRLKPMTRDITTDFIRYIVQSDLFYEQIKLLQTGSTIQHFGPIHLQQMKVLLPPVNEQNSIVEEIKHSIRHIDILVENAEKIIDLTKERKIALISAAVTGKIDVR